MVTTKSELKKKERDGKPPNLTNLENDQHLSLQKGYNKTMIVYGDLLIDQATTKVAKHPRDGKASVQTRTARQSAAKYPPEKR